MQVTKEADIPLGKEESICEIVRAELRAVPRYREEHRVRAVVDPSVTIVSYQTLPPHKYPEATRFDLNFVGDICYLLWLGVEPAERRNGNGTKLYTAIENIARKLDSKRIHVDPSGSGYRFWPKMGFVECDEGMEKLLFPD